MHVHEVFVRPEEYFSGYFAKNEPKPEEEEEESNDPIDRIFRRKSVEKR